MAKAYQREAEDAQKSLAASERQLGEARNLINDLKPLAVWAGHPCCVCGSQLMVWWTKRRLRSCWSTLATGIVLKKQG